MRSMFIILFLFVGKLDLSAKNSLNDAFGAVVVPSKAVEEIDKKNFSRDMEPPLFSKQEKFESFTDIAFEQSIYRMNRSEAIAYHHALMAQDKEIASADPAEFNVKGDLDGKNIHDED